MFFSGTWLKNTGKTPVPSDIVYCISSGRPVSYQVTETFNSKGFFVCGALVLPDGDGQTFFDAADMYLYRNWFFDCEAAMAELRGRI